VQHDLELQKMTEREELLARVASMYYEQNRNQDEIAREIGVSRSTVSRALQEARESGVVEITVHYPWKRDTELEHCLVDQLHLRDARVLLARKRTEAEVLRGLGVLAARYLESVLCDGSVLGISWGVAVYSTARALRPSQSMSITVVQMVGAVGEGDPLIDGPDLARVLARSYGGESRYLHAPLIVEDADARRILMQEPRIGETLELARAADVALVGIGAPDASVSSLLRAGYLTEGDLDELRARGVVGDVCARHYDISGHPLDLALNHRIVGVDLADLHGIDRVIGVAGSVAKASAILGALRGKHVSVIVTDDVTARRVLAMSKGVAVNGPTG